MHIGRYGMTNKSWTNVWQTRATNLMSRRFLGFWGTLALSYFRPEIVGQLIMIYAILVGGKLGEAYIQEVKK